MNYTVNIDQGSQTIKVKATGQLSQEIRKNILLDISRQLKKCNYSKVLVDLTETSFDYHVPMTGAQELVTFMRAIGIPSHAKLAFIYSEAEPHRKHYQNIAQDSGFNIRYFKDLEAATEWLE